MSGTAATNPSSVAGFPPSAMGVTPPSNPDRQGAFLTDVIAELGFADQDSVDEAVDATRQSTKTPEHYLLDTGAIDERQLSLAMAERNSLDHVDLDQFEVDPEVTSLIDKSTAARYSALPIAFATDGALLVAIEDPFDLLGISDIEVMTRNEVRPVIATGTQIQGLIASLPDKAKLPVTYLPEQPAPTLAPDGSQEPEAWPAPQPLALPEMLPHQEPTSEQIAPPTPSEQQVPSGSPGPQAASSEHDQENTMSEPTQNGDGLQPESVDKIDVELGELSAAFTAMQERMSHASSLVGAVERRIGELQDVDDRAQQAATELADERREFELERQRGLQRERELEGELSTAREELEDAKARAQETAAGLSNERTELEQERQAGLQRERELEGELSTAREELEEAKARAQETAAGLSNERTELEQERQAGLQRERELEGELSTAREELEEAKARAQETAAGLSNERTELEQERQAGLQRERELEGELSTAREELEDAKARAQETAAGLSNERTELEQERQAGLQRERELEGELSTARERITALEERVSKVTAAAKLASSATKKLTALQGILRDEQPPIP